jgi:hypothetical protein
MKDKQFIVTTSIYEPTEATKKYAEMEDWTLIVVGDLKTPHESYNDINCVYLHPDWQQEHYPELSDAIGWNCVMRRNIGFVEAYKRGAEVVATIDDDNIPYSEWGFHTIGLEDWEVDLYSNDKEVFDPLSVTSLAGMAWHRGYPLELAYQSSNNYKGRKDTKVLIQADLWDGDPDIDAVCRKLTGVKDIKLEALGYYTSDNYTPFNSQNTFLAREILPYYMVLPHVGRMDDIWGGYICEYLTGARPVFGPPTVYQKRNEQSIKKNLQDEVLGYTDTLNFVQNIDKWEELLPEKAAHAFRVYRKQYE